MRPKSVTQKDVAERVGVSTATVSRALNDQPGVTPDVRARILRAAREMGYSRSANAHSLVTSVRHTVAFVVHAAHAAAEDPFYPVIMTGAEAYLSQHDYHVLLSTFDGQATTRPQEFPVVSQGLVDGLIIAGPDIPPAFIVGMLAADVPLVLVDNCLSQTAANCVLTDDHGGAYSATCHLIEHGHVRIAFLSGPRGWASSQERARGYRDAMEAARLEPLILEGPQTTIATGAELIRRALERWPDVSAVCAVNDAVAIGAMRSATELGRYIPDDLAVIGFDDVSWASMNEPSLSTVRVFKRRIGELAAQRLLDCIQNPDAAPVKILVSTELVVRESCGHKH